MIITKEFIDTVALKHDRISCSDDKVSNGYSGWNGKYNQNTGEKQIIHPRCDRCYLLDNLGKDSKDLLFSLSLILTWKEEK